MSSLRTRLMLAVGLVAIVAVAAVALSARHSTRVAFQRFQDVERVRESVDTRAMLDAATAALDHRCCTTEAVSAARAAIGPDEALLVLDASGVLQAASGFDVDASELHVTVTNDELRIEGRVAGASASVSVVLKGGPSAPLTLADGRRATLRLVAMPHDRVEPAEQILSTLDRRLILATMLVAAIALVVAWGVSQRITKPLAELRDAARDLSTGDLSRRVAASGSDEVAELGRGFNAMAAELERQQTLRRNLVHDVAHELRTPLTALRCRIETAIDGLAEDSGRTLAQMNEEVVHLSQLVNDLEEMARAEAGDLALTITDVRVADVCRSAIRTAHLDADPRVALELDEAAIARADAVRTRQILLNLLTNADRYTPHRGAIAVRTTRQDREVVIAVHNTGSAIAPDDLARIFDRFYRADPSRQRATGGSGLGLAIVKHLSEAQGGRVWASSDASGVTVSVALPIAIDAA